MALSDREAWVFNRMADVYGARPPYPESLVAALLALLPDGARRVGDVGAGVGHLALPLAARGCAVTAIEPAEAMLERLRESARSRGLSITALHAAAESLPLSASSLDLVVVADALHFLDAERAGLEIGRVLRAGGALALITCELGDTPFMRALVRLMEESAPRRPRVIGGNMAQLASLAGVSLGDEQRFHDETSVEPTTLERILRSISFIGPAMNAARFAAFRERVSVLSDTPAWARTFVLRSGIRR